MATTSTKNSTPTSNSVNVTNRNGMLSINSSNIPSNISYAKRFAARLFANKLGINQNEAYSRISTSTNKAGDRIYSVSRA